MEELSQNTLTELQDLMSRILNEIDKYKHVSEHLPKSLTKSIDSFCTKLDNEYDRREDEEY